MTTPAWHVCNHQFIDNEMLLQIVEAKKYNPNIYRVTLDGPWFYGSEHRDSLSVVFRPLTRDENETLSNLRFYNLSFNRDFVIYGCIFYPSEEEWNEAPAGLIESIYDIIEGVSAWNSEESLVSLHQAQRNSIESEDGQQMSTMLDIVISTGLGMEIDRIRHLDAYETLKMLAITENRFGKKIDLRSKETIDREEEQRERAFREKFGDGNTRRRTRRT